MFRPFSDHLSLTPDPYLSPADVVKIQLDALQNNDLMPNNAGIRTAWNFASPANRAATGPLDRFIELVKNPPYMPIVGFEWAELTQVLIRRGQAQLAARLFHPHFDEAIYAFILSIQEAAPYYGCWMTDGVLPVP
jgi:hypothetical protein